MSGSHRGSGALSSGHNALGGVAVERRRGKKKKKKNRLRGHINSTGLAKTIKEARLHAAFVRTCVCAAPMHAAVLDKLEIV